MIKTVTVEPVTRIEGHAKITIDFDDGGAVVGGHLHVLELRGFEKLVEGMELVKMPLVTARICGVCPAAHHLASVIAIENGCGVTIPPEAHRLRELLYMGHILHSHALSCFVLTGPDLLIPKEGEKGRKRSVFTLLSNDPETAKKALRIRSIGQKIVEKVGGRGIHPVTAVAGGISSHPDAEDISTIRNWGSEALTVLQELYPLFSEKLSALQAIRTATELPMNAVALGNNGFLDFLSGAVSVIDRSGKVVGSFTAADYDKALVEGVMPGSYMKSVRLRSGPSYFVGPLARLAVNGRCSMPTAQKLLDAFRKRTASGFNAVDAIEGRLIEMVYAAERIIDLCNALRPADPIYAPVSIKGGVFRSIIEAPRGILIHDYTADEQAHIVSANLIIATQNNYDAIDAVITSLARYCKASEKESELIDAVEFGVRCFDPCLSCATHPAGRMPLEVELRRNGVVFRTLYRSD